MCRIRMRREAIKKGDLHYLALKISLDMKCDRGLTDDGGPPTKFNHLVSVICIFILLLLTSFTTEKTNKSCI